MFLSGCSGDNDTAPETIGTRQSGNILLISIDTLRADHMGIYGYERPTTPNIDRWFNSKDSAIYKRAYTTDASTSPSVVSMLSGLLPQDHGVRLLYQVLSPEIKLLPDLLPDTYQTSAVVSNIVLTDEAVGIADRFDYYDDFVDQKEPYRQIFERNAEKTTDAALKWFSQKRDPSKPWFLWVHYIDPHGPYHPPSDWKKSFTHPRPMPIDIRRVPAYQREPEINDGLTYVDLYDEEIAYLDSQLGRLLDAIDKQQSLDETLVIFTADHGESMMEHERWFTHSYHVFEEITHIPLMVRAPGNNRGYNEKLVSLIDIPSTILQYTGAKELQETPTINLLNANDIPETRMVYSEGRQYLSADQVIQHRAVIQGNEKWIISVRDKDEAILFYTYYDLLNDPAEKWARQWGNDNVATKALLNLHERDPAIAGVPIQYQQGEQLQGPKVAPNVDTKTIQKLKSLGYIQ